MRQGTSTSQLFALIVSATLVVTSARATEPTVSKQASSDVAALAEITVTARKIEEKISDVPMSLSAFGSTELVQRRIVDLTDIAKVTPGLTFQTNQGLDVRISIRGIETTYGAPTTAVYLDDAPINLRTGNAAFALAMPLVFDLERVEVLRGPQGTLFGASAMGGAVRFISKEPDLTQYTGYARGGLATTYNGGGSSEAGAAVGGPIVDGKLGFRLSAWSSDDGGYVDHFSRIPGGAFQQNSNSVKSYVFQGALQWAMTDSVRATLRFFAESANYNDEPAFWQPISNPPKEEFTFDSLKLEPIREKFELPSLKLEANVAGVQLTSVTTYFTREYSQTIDYTDVIPAAIGAPLPTSADAFDTNYNYTNQHNFTQEIRANSSAFDGRLTWIAGAYYSDARQQGYQLIWNPGFPALIQQTFGASVEQIFGTGMYQGVYSGFADTHWEDQQLAGFVSGDFKLVGGLSVSAGVRVEDDKNSFQFQGGGPLYNVPPASNVERETPVTPRFVVTEKFDEDNLLYASATKGYRPGGGNSPLSTTGAACTEALASLGQSTQSYKADSLWSYELGSKNKVFGGTTNIAASIFDIEWKNIQQSIYVPECANQFIGNLGAARSKGADLSIEAAVTRSLLVVLTAGYTNATFTSTNEVGGVVDARSGEWIGAGDVSPFTGTVLAQYAFRWLNSDAYARLEDNWVVRNTGQFPFQNPADHLYNPHSHVNDGYNTLSATLAVTRAGCQITGYVDNLFNTHPLLLNYTAKDSAVYGAYTVKPRTAGIKVSYRW